MAVFMLETLKLSKTLKSSRDDFNVLDNFNVSSIKTANFDDFTLFFAEDGQEMYTVLKCTW